jgi:dimethylglycine dehydrogenase
LRDDDLLRARAAGFDVVITRVTDDIGIIGMMGPASRAMLESLTKDDLGPWMSVRQITVAGVPVRAMRLSYVGELGWELHAPADRTAELFLALEAAGKPHGAGLFGAYAMNAMRIEKGYPAWGSDFTTERTPAETGMGFLVKPAHAFIGRDEVVRRSAEDKRWDLVMLEIEPGQVDPYFSHGIWQGDRCVGVVTSAAHGHRTGKTLALAYLRDRHARDGLTVEVLGQKRGAVILDRPAFDPGNKRQKEQG